MGASNQSAMIALFAGFAIVFAIVGIAFWLLQSCAYYKMFKKANVECPWLAFIPLGNLWPYMWTIKKSAWNILWLLVPIANVVFAIIWFVRLLKAFNMNPWWSLLMIGSIVLGFIPFSSVLSSLSGLCGLGLIVLLCVMGFNSKITYNPNFDSNDQPPNITA